MDEGELAQARHAHRVLERVIEIVALEHHFAAEVEHGLHLDVRRRPRHHDHRRDATTLCRERDALRMVARRRADDAARGRGVVERGDLV